MINEYPGRTALVMRFSALGDIAMSIPALYDACRSCPGTRFVYLTRKHPACLFINAPANLTVVGVDLRRYKGFGGMWRLFSEIRGEYGIDTVVDLHDVLRTKTLRWLFRLAGARVAHIRKGRAEKRRLTRRRDKILLQLEPTAERYADTFRRAHICARRGFRSVFGDGKGPEAAFSHAAAPKTPHERWIAIAPFAKHPGKIYPPEMMRKVTDALASEPDTRIFLFGAGEKEKAVLSEWASGKGNVVNMAEADIGLPSELALLSHCDVMVSMDSANMHLASLVGLKTVSVWGATHPFAGFMGFGQSADRAVQLDMICRPCSVFGDKPCFRGDYNCLHGIPPSLILSHIGKALGRQPDPSRQDS